MKNLIALACLLPLVGYCIGNGPYPGGNGSGGGTNIYNYSAGSTNIIISQPFTAGINYTNQSGSNLQVNAYMNIPASSSGRVLVSGNGVGGFDYTNVLKNPDASNPLQLSTTFNVAPNGYYTIQNFSGSSISVMQVQNVYSLASGSTGGGGGGSFSGTATNLTGNALNQSTNIALSQITAQNINSSLPGIVTNVSVGNTWYVDQIVGNDATGTNSISFKFKNIYPAATNAANKFQATGIRQLVEVAPGLYAANNLGFDGVNYDFEPGCTVSNFCNDFVTNQWGVPSWYPIFTDCFNTNGIKMTISGDANFVWNMGSNYWGSAGIGINVHPLIRGSTNASSCILITNPASNVTIKMRDGIIYSTSAGVSQLSGGDMGESFIQVKNCEFFSVDGRQLLDGYWGTPPFTFTNAGNGGVTTYKDSACGIFWNIGEFHVHFDKVGDFADNGIWCEETDPSNTLQQSFFDIPYCKANLYVDGVTGLTNDWSSFYKNWFNFLSFETSTNNPGNGLDFYGGYNYVNAQKIVTDPGMTGIYVYNGDFTTTPTKVWLTVQKIEGHGTLIPSSGWLMVRTNCSVNGFVGQFDGNTANASAGIYNYGTIDLTGNNIVSTNSVAVAQIGPNSKMTLRGYVIDTSLGGNTNSPIFAGSSNLTLVGCIINPPTGTKAISGTYPVNGYYSVSNSLTGNGSALTNLNPANLNPVLGILKLSTDCQSNAWSLATATNGMLNFTTRFHVSSNGVPTDIYLSNGITYFYNEAAVGGGIIP